MLMCECWFSGVEKVEFKLFVGVGGVKLGVG